MKMQFFRSPSLAVLLLSAGLAWQISTSAADPRPPVEEGIIPEHGKYTRAYQSDWSKLPAGDVLAKKDVSNVQFQEVTGEQAKREWRGEKRVVISNLNLKVKWDHPKPDKFGTTLFYVEDAGEVVIENLNIISADPDYRQYHTIYIEGAERVIIRNLYLAGTVQSYHIRLEGCKEVLIDGVEIAGIDYNGTGRRRLGGGIWINNGDGKPGQAPLTAKHPKLPGWQVVQNCYLHDNSESDGTERNQDAVLVHSAGDGLLFNCVVENWMRHTADASFDLSFRRGEPEFQDRFFRIERNIIKNATFYKSVGNVPGPNMLFWANNLFINSTYADYHRGAADSVFVNNTYIFDLEKAPENLRGLAMRGSEGYCCLWGYSGPTALSNGLLFKPGGRFFMFYQNAEPPEDKYHFFVPNHNLYAVGNASTAWLRTAQRGVVFATLDAWREATSQDKDSLQIDGGPEIFADYAKGDYRPVIGAVPPGVPNPHFLKPGDPRQKVDRDFYGVLRSEAKELVPGAFCATPSPEK